MVEQEEAERLEELERFLDTASDSELDSDNASQSGGDDARSDAEALDEENENSSDENNGDSTESEPDAPRLRKRPGRKPKPIKKKKRRKPKDRPQIVGLRVEQFYADGTANMVVKNALSKYCYFFRGSREINALCALQSLLEYQCSSALRRQTL